MEGRPWPAGKPINQRFAQNWALNFDPGFVSNIPLRRSQGSRLGRSRSDPMGRDLPKPALPAEFGVGQSEGSPKSEPESPSLGIHPAGRTVCACALATSGPFGSASFGKRLRRHTQPGNSKLGGSNNAASYITSRATALHHIATREVAPHQIPSVALYPTRSCPIHGGHGARGLR